MSVQLTLGLQLKDEATFTNFFDKHNEILIAYLHQVLQSTNDRFTYICGSRGFGKTHLLQACCHEMNAQEQPVVYLPLSQHELFSPDILENLEDMSLVCLDDIDAIAGMREWEEGLFGLYNRIFSSPARLVVSASNVPTETKIQLPDLVSRLSACTIFQLHALDDREKIIALQLHAKVRGIALSDEVGDFILTRCERNMHDLLAVLETLDKASFVAQRRLTIPFVRETLLTE